MTNFKLSRRSYILQVQSQKMIQTKQDEKRLLNFAQKAIQAQTFWKAVILCIFFILMWVCFYKLSQNTLPFFAEMQFSTKKRIFRTVLRFWKKATIK
jgi:hypothetical protein